MQSQISWFLLQGAVLVLIVIYLLFFYVKNCFKYWKKRNVPFFKPALPAGNFNVTLKAKKNFGETVSALYFEAKRKSYKYVGIFLSTKPILLLIDPDLVRVIFTTYFSNFNGRGIPVNEKLDPMNAHLFNLAGEKWKKIRSKVAPLFSTAKMRGMFPLVLNNGKQLEETIEEIAFSGGAIDAKDLSEKFTTDNIGSCVFGLQCNSFKSPNSEFRKYGRQYITESISNAFKIILSLVAPKILDVFRIPFVPAKTSAYYSRIFNEVVKERIKTGENRKDFIDLFIQIQQSDNLDEEDDTRFKKQVTFEELSATAFVFFIAGFETSSSTMNFCLYELAKHQDIQDKVREEIQRILKNNNGELTYEGLMKMNYTERVIQETLRKYPTLPQLSRSGDEDFHVPGTNLVIEKDLMIWIPVLGLHMDPDFFPEPEKFDPDRFSEENKSKIYPGTYLPFGDGPRYCIGTRFGQTQIKIGIAKFIQKYKYAIHEDCLPLEFDVKNALLTAKNKVLLKAYKIT